MDRRCRHEFWSAWFGPDVAKDMHGEIQVNLDEGGKVATRISAPVDINGKGSKVTIGTACDIAAFVTITTADSHRRCIERADEVDRRPVEIGDHVFVGQGATILGGCKIGHHSVIGAGVVLHPGTVIEPYSRVHLPAPIIESGYYSNNEKTSMFAAYRKLRGKA